MNKKDVLKKLGKISLLILILSSFVLSATGCFFEEDVPITEDMISEEQIINRLKNSTVIPGYDVTYGELFSIMFLEAEYHYYTFDEMKKNVPHPDDPNLEASVEVLVKAGDGKVVLFAWDVIFDEDFAGGFDIQKKVIYDYETGKSYTGDAMDEQIDILMLQYMRARDVMGPLLNLVP